MRSPLAAILFLLTYLAMVPVNSKAQGLKEQSQDSTAIDTSGYYPGDNDFNVLIAAYKGYKGEVIRLVDKGADINHRSDRGLTPLMFATGNGDVEMVRLLLDLEANPDLRANNGETALIMAVRNNDLAMTEELIRGKADFTLLDGYGTSALHYAAAYNNLTIADMLLYYGAPVDLETSAGLSPMQAAVWAGNYDVARMFLDFGANPNHQDDEGFTALILSAQNNDTAMLRMLVRNGASLFIRNNYGYDPLLTAIKHGHRETAELLLTNPDIWEYKKKEGLDPFTVARVYSRKNLLDLLQEKGVPGRKGIRFDQLTLGVNSLVSTEDMIPGFTIVTTEPRFLTDLGAGFYSRPWRKRVVVETPEGVNYQYWEQRTIVAAGISKRIKLYEKAFRHTGYLEISAREYFTFGPEYRGSENSPETAFLFVPGMGLAWKKGRWLWRTQYRYMKFPGQISSPHYLNIGLSYSFYYDNSRGPDRVLKWY